MVARVAGDIDSVTSGELRHGVSRRLTNVVPGLILDLTEATYVDSAGIEFLFDLAERLRSRGQRLRLVVPLEGPHAARFRPLRHRGSNRRGCHARRGDRGAARAVAAGGPGGEGW